MATGPQIYPPVGGGSSTGSTTGSATSNGSTTGYGNTYVGNYGNLPQGISNAGGGGNNAYVQNVQGNQLVSNQLNGLLNTNSPYMQQAYNQGINTANSRGLLNSSIAAGNAQASAINAALPIAQADASTYTNAANQNQQYLNQVLMNQQNNATSRANAGTAAATQRDINAANLAYQGTQSGLNRGFQDYMAQQAQQFNLQNQAFNLGGNLLQSNDNFTHQMYLNQADNPFAMSNPQALQGYIDYGNQNNNSYYDNLFNFATNGGQNQGNWYENTDWYSSPYQQNAGYDPYGTYLGGF